MDSRTRTPRDPATPARRRIAPLRKAAAELVGTFFITLVPIVIDIAYFTHHGVDYVSRWLARGFIATAMIYSFAGVSGAHLDPVVSLAFWARGDFRPRRLALYIVAQFIGAFLAATLAYSYWGTAIGFGASHPSPGVPPVAAFVAEIVLTALLITVILATARGQAAVGRQAAIAVGLTIAACGLAGGTISGASMNPARSLAPQVFAGDFSVVWVYLAGPVLGALAAAAVAPVLFGRPDSKERKAARGE